MELRKLCAYNQTRECFLGLEVGRCRSGYAALRAARKAYFEVGGGALDVALPGNSREEYAGPAGSDLPGRGVPGH